MCVVVPLKGAEATSPLGVHVKVMGDDANSSHTYSQTHREGAGQGNPWIE